MSADVITYQFTGDCAIGNCNGTGVGMLTLTDYTLGSEVNAANFVGFTYHSGNIDLAITPATLQSIDGFIFGPLPSPEYVFLRDINSEIFNSLDAQQTAAWCSGSSCGQDYGSNSVWADSTNGSLGAVPEPAMFLPVAGAVLGLAVKRRRRA